MSKLSWWKTAWALCALGMAAAIALPAQTFTTLQSFDNTDGYYPYAAPVQGTDGNLYGTTLEGGANDTCTYGCGTVFKISMGRLTTLHNFDSTDGAYPYAGLVQGADGNFYGTTYSGGANGNCNDFGCGTVFKITLSGTLTTLHSFESTDGANPYAGLIQGTDGSFYGTTQGGGANFYGTVFKITASGTLSTIYSFCSQSGCTDGTRPSAALVQATDGDFYGTTEGGGSAGSGTVFKITPGGALTTLYTFCSQSGCADGGNPYAALVQATDGNFYGTTTQGGLGGRGTAFKITAGGALTTLHSFCTEGGCADGATPYAALAQGTNGIFYGTTQGGGNPFSFGTLFRITPSGVLTTLYFFCSQGGCTDGASPTAGLIQDTNGKFYGTTSIGGAHNSGTVFSLSVGLVSFVETLPTFGKVGSAIRILGTDLKGATSVTFNGTAAVFKVVSGSLISTTVPAGATTGTVQVVTPGGTLSSNVPFRVLP